MPLSHLLKRKAREMKNAFDRSVVGCNRKFYDTNARAYCRTTQDADMTSLHMRFASRVPANGTVLDAGCGSGRDSLVFKKLGLNVTAIDASPEMVSFARKRGVRAKVSLFQKLSIQSHFDGIWASATLLHIPHRELHDVLTRFRCALKPDGVIFVSLKEGTGERIEADGRFFSYFTVSAFREQARRAGFNVLEETKSAPSVPGGPCWIQFMLSPSRSEAGRSRKLNRALVSA